MSDPTSAQGAGRHVGSYGRDVNPKLLGTMLLWDIGLPVVGYYLSRTMGLSTFNALLVATGISALRLLWVVWRTKELDPFAAFMLFVFALGTAASFLTGDARYMILKNALLTLIVGVVFLGSCLRGKPLTFAVARRLAGKGHAREDLDRGWAESPELRSRFRQLGWLWGGGLVAEALLRVVIIYTVSVDIAVGASTAVQLVAIALMAWLTINRIKHEREQADAAAGADPAVGTG